MVELHKLPNETEEQFIWRLGQAKDAGLLDMDWEGIASVVNTEFREDESEYRSECAYRKPYQSAKRFFESGVFKDLTSEGYIKSLELEKRELFKARQKLRDEKLEYNRWLREEARDELICENICSTTKALPPLEFPKKRTVQIDVEKTGIAIFADAHYGTEYFIRGLHNEIINQYSPEIFEARMCDFFQHLINIVEKEHLTKIKLYSLGDELDGILRASQLMKLRYAVVESTIKYADYITNWLNELTKYVQIEFQMVSGNHTELRMINQPKGTFVDDNMSKVIREFISIRLEGNPNFTMLQNSSGLIFDTIEGYNILGIHGEVKDLSKAITNFTNTYNTVIDILIGGHMHHLKTETIGVNRDVISVPSVIGIDDYSMTLGKTSSAGAIFLIIEKKKGITQQYNIKFDV